MHRAVITRAALLKQNWRCVCFSVLLSYFSTGCFAWEYIASITVDLVANTWKEHVTEIDGFRQILGVHSSFPTSF